MSKSKKKSKAEDDEDFDVVEYEEVILSDVEDEPSTEASCSSTKSDATKTPVQKTKSMSFSESCTAADIEKLAADKTVKKIVRKPARPIRLFSFTDHDIIDKFALADPAKKNLTMQLLNVVKSVNLRRKLKVDKDGTAVPNFYLIATTRDLPDKSRKISSMKSGDIVSLIKEIIHMIKTCVYREVDDIEIICDSPAIFLIKYVNVKNWDSAMNSVYIVTSEYILPYLCKIRAAQEQERNSKLLAVKIMRDKSNKRKPKQSSSSTQTAKRPKLSTKPAKVKPLRYESTRDTDPLRNIRCVPSDEDVVESILSKYLEQEAVDFFISQMKTTSKLSNRLRWSDRDKFFALGLLRKNPTEYSILYENYSLPSDKTIDKFLKQIKSERIDDIRIVDE